MVSPLPFLIMSTALTLSSRYFARLGLDPTELDQGPTLNKLKQLHEAHLARIPFDNLAQHGVVGGMPLLDIEAVANKILHLRRGGFCFEVNLLFAAFLQELGYQVKRLPAFVYAADGYRAKPTHVILLVCCKNQDNNISEHFVDVGFGEPPLHPLDYGLIDEEQVTPEGMQSKLVQTNEGFMVLHWWKDGVWVPRSMWSCTYPLEGYDISYFQSGLDAVLDPSSPFSQKLIVTLLTREQKLTLAGSRLKKTGSPRFPHPTNLDQDEPVPVTIEYVTGEEEARALLRDKFHIPLDSTKGLSLTKSNTANKETWSVF